MWLIITLLPLSDYISLHAGSHSAVLAAAVKAPHSAEAGELQDWFSTRPGWQLEDPDHSNPPRYVGISVVFFCLFFYLQIKCFFSRVLTLFVKLLQLNTLHGNLSVQCHLLLASRATGVVTSTIWNVSCLVHSSSRFAVKCCCFLAACLVYFRLFENTQRTCLSSFNSVFMKHVSVSTEDQMFLLMGNIFITL